MPTRGRQVIDSLKRKFKDSFDIVIESDNKLPLDNGATYNPDLVLRSKKDKKIKVIIEVEQGTRKHVVGGVITADYSMKQSKEKPLMCVLALTEQRRKGYLKRKKLLEQYTKNLKKIVIGSRKEVMQELRRLAKTS